MKSPISISSPESPLKHPDVPPMPNLGPMVKPGASHADHTHPGHQKPIHTSHGGADHSHAHMRFHAPKEVSKNPSHFKTDIHASTHTGKGKHVIPVGQYGPASADDPNTAGNIDPSGGDSTAPDPSADNGAVAGYGGDDPTGGM